jgi:hypothetical protein
LYVDTCGDRCALGKARPVVVTSKVSEMQNCMSSIGVADVLGLGLSQARYKKPTSRLATANSSSNITAQK